VLPTKGLAPTILKSGSRFAIPLGGGSTRTVQVLVLKLGRLLPVRLRLSGKTVAPRALVRIQVSALDPWGRRGAFILSFRAP